ncbi:MAG: hypothetical protein ACLVBX_00645 [Faecalibacterium prausnitzii]
MTETQRSRVHVTVAGQQFPKLDATDYAALIREKRAGRLCHLAAGPCAGRSVDALYQGGGLLPVPVSGNLRRRRALLMAYSYSKPVLASSIPAFEEETDGAARACCSCPKSRTH